ncbi:ABC transporter permease [Halovivax gelatinilyticus]|uniref:ABC transporter permease n=1 Tax=Halovivax gelatinilyticus TaxID=2961597 RepID=UPI0020CA4248|nr:ABC transporter permease [Halovivax gelatinilyticus]
MSPSRSLLSALGARIAWACGLVLVVVSAMFALISSTTDPEARSLHAPPDAADEPPLREQYVEFMGSFLRFEWGESNTASVWAGDPIIGESASNAGAVVTALPITLAYVIPSALLAFGLALVAGYVAASRPRAWHTRLTGSSMYVLFSLPNFFLAAVIFYTLQDLDPSWFPSEYQLDDGFSTSNLLWLTLPGFVLTTHLVAGFFRYTRAETREALKEEYVKLVRAKGSSSPRVARHVFRNAALPLFSLFVAELIGVLLVTVFVIEVVFEVPGVGLLTYQGIVNREIELVMVLTALFATTCILANLIEDLATVSLDPRASVGE